MCCGVAGSASAAPKQICETHPRGWGDSVLGSAYPLAGTARVRFGSPVQAAM